MNRGPSATHRLRRAFVLATVFAASGCAPVDAADSVLDDLAASLEPSPHAMASDREWYIYRLLPDEGSGQNGFGWDVDLSGSTAVVGDPRSLAAYVFVRTNDGWREQATLAPPVPALAMTFGASVAISRDTIVVGATSRSAPPSAATAYVYQRSGTTWGPGVALVPTDGTEGDRFGFTVDVDGDTIVVGALNADGIAVQDGAVYVFERSGSTWPQAAKLAAPDGYRYNEFGRAVAISGTTILVGAPNAPVGNQVGAAYVYTRSGDTWSDGEKLELPESLLSPEFGDSVALGDDVAVVGAPRDAGPRGPYRAGLAFVYRRSGQNWSLQPGELHADDPVTHDVFGSAVAVSGDSVMVGAPGEGNAGPAGAESVYVFELSTGALRAHIGARGGISRFGGSLGLDGNVAVVGTQFGDVGAYAVELRAPDGSPCESNLDCGSWHCAQGVCCNAPCSGACETCATGACTPLPRSVVASCGPYLCGEGGDCPTDCVADAQCADDYYCRNGECRERRPNGASCEHARDCKSGTCIDDACAGTFDNGAGCRDAADCKSGFCVDDFCCDQRCDGQCEACDARGSAGACVPVDGAPHGDDRPPCDGAGTSCSGRCDGEHSAACVYDATGETCATSCVDGELTESFCNGRGECEPSEPRSCNELVCADELSCKTRCANSDDCVLGTACHDGACESRPVCIDEDTMVHTDHSTEECGRYVCSEGSCKRACENAADCRTDSTCHQSRCVQRPPRSGRSATEGGGCAVRPGVASDAGTAFGFVVVLAGAALRCVRRSKRPNAIAHRPG